MQTIQETSTPAVGHQFNAGDGLLTPDGDTIAGVVAMVVDGDTIVVDTFVWTIDTTLRLIAKRDGDQWRLQKPTGSVTVVK